MDLPLIGQRVALASRFGTVLETIEPIYGRPSVIVRFDDGLIEEVDPYLLRWSSFHDSDLGS